MDNTQSINWANWPDRQLLTAIPTSDLRLPQRSWWQWWYDSRLVNSVNKLGKDVQLFGKAKVLNQGHIQIGDHSILLSEYQQLRLAVRQGGHLEIGKHCYINSAILSANVRIQIGDYCKLGPFVHLMDSNFHDLQDRQKEGTSGEIIIGQGARLGANVIVLQGTTIGEGAEVLPGSVVTKNIPAGACYGGVPARQVQLRRNG
ncbi:MAG: acyltransferase [Bacteroidota bacterium]